MDINMAWKGTCRAIFGKELGELRDYSKFLQKFNPQSGTAVSMVSGKPLAIDNRMKRTAKFIAYDEAPKLAKPSGLKIDDLKDIDSLMESVQEQAVYSGNIVLGNSGSVESTNRCIDSFHVLGSEDVFFSKYVAYSWNVNMSEYIFGSPSIGEDSFAISTYECYKNSRTFQAVRTYHSADCYYTANLENCQDCLFSFSLRNRRNCIGNLELSREKFSGLKGKLVAEMADELEGKKNVPSVMHIIIGKEVAL